MLWIAPFLLAALAAEPLAPPKEEEIVVYFQRDSANMRQAALDVVDSTVWRIRSGNGMISIEGHTSTLGDDAYNVRLAERRAVSVRDALVARGVPSARITTEALGEARPARPTADGVDEPLNDRVVIRVQ